MWYETFGPGFFIAVTGTFFGFCGLIVRAALKSNCQKVSCCFGIAECIRGVEDKDIILDTPSSRGRGIFAPPNTPQSLHIATSL